MRLNTECVRDLLLYLEEHLSYQSPTITVNNIVLKDYTEEELVYTAEKLNEAGYIDCILTYAYQTPIIIVRAISYSGHQFMDTIRDNKIWAKTKKKLSNLASISLPILQDLASSIIKQHLNI